MPPKSERRLYSVLPTVTDIFHSVRITPRSIALRSRDSLDVKRKTVIPIMLYDNCGGKAEKG